MDLATAKGFRKAAAEHRALTVRSALTTRELEIARLAGAGVGNKEIAARLFLSRHTVQNKLHSAYEKLGVEGREELAQALGGLLTFLRSVLTAKLGHLGGHVLNGSGELSQGIDATKNRVEASGVEAVLLDARCRLNEMADDVEIFVLLLAEAPVGQAGLNPGSQQDGVDGLIQEVVGAQLDAADHGVEAVDARDHDDGGRLQPPAASAPDSSRVEGKVIGHAVRGYSSRPCRRRSTPRPVSQLVQMRAVLHLAHWPWPARHELPNATG